MKILYLGPEKNEFIKSFNVFNDEIVVIQDKISIDDLIRMDVDIIISYGYRHLITKDIISFMENRIFNLHISYLPWNRGADPNFWSFYENTPKGVTIHLIDEGIDTGDIFYQKRVNFSENETLSSSYKKLVDEIEALFIKKWCDIRNGSFKTYPQNTKQGSLHYAKDLKKHLHLLTKGWETPINNIINKRGAEI